MSADGDQPRPRLWGHYNYSYVSQLARQKTFNGYSKRISANFWQPSDFMTSPLAAFFFVGFNVLIMLGLAFW